MNSKERVLTAISHKEADSIPVDSWFAQKIHCQIYKPFYKKSKLLFPGKETFL